MITTPVMNGINPLMGLGASRQTGKLQEELAGSFTDAFSKATGQQQNMSLQKDAGVKQNAQVKQGGKEQKGLDDSKAVKIKDSSSSQNTSKAENPKTMDKVKGEMEKSGKELVGKVAEELGVSEEEVIRAMGTLGLAFADLLNADNMTQLVLTLEDADMLTLMTDGGLYDSLQNLLGEVAQQLTQIGKAVELSPEELNVVMEQLGQQEGQPEIAVDADAEVDAKADSETKAEGKADWNTKDSGLPDGQEDYTVTVERNGGVMKVSVEVDGNAKTETAEVTNVKVDVPEEKEVRPAKKEEGAKQEDSSSHGSNNHANVLLDHLLNRENAVVQPEASFEAAMAGRTVDTREIMDQIMNYMRIQVKADMTQMQLQLHPASLGTVNINIAAKAGVITAQFMTQNEAVKSVLESQIVQLRNQFEEQGLKVDAVEVTVESHAFERNLNEQGESRHASQEGKKRGVRKLNLKDMDLEENVMDEDDQLAVEMMRAGGGTVDFTA